MAEQYTNIRLLIDKIMRHPLMQDLTLETIVDYTIDFMRIVGVPNMFENKIEILHIENYRAMLPCDYYNIIQVKDCRTKLAFRYTTDSFHLSDKNNTDNLTYKIQGGVIFTSIKEGDIELSYEAIATDKEGYPLLIDNSSFIRSLELYIKKQWFTILFDMGKVSPAVLQNIQQEYAWAVGDCQSEFNRLSIDKAESLYNSWRTLLIRDKEHKTGFKTNGVKEKIRIH